MIGLFLRLFALVVLRTAAAAVATLLVIVLLLALVLGSTPGTAWLLRALAEGSDGAVQVEGAEGSLLGGISATSLLIRSESVTIGGTDLRIAFFWPDLLRARLRVREALAGALTIEASGGAAEQPPTLPERLALPLGLVVDTLRVASLTVRRDDFEQRIEAVDLAGSWIGERLRLGRLALVLDGVALELQGEGRLAGSFPLALQFGWAAEAAALAGQGTLRGDLAELQIEQTLRLPDPLRAQLVLRDVVAAPTWRLTAEWDGLARELPGLGRLYSRGGRLSADGSLEDWALQLEGELALDELPTFGVQLRAAGDLSQAAIDDLRLSGLGGTLDATGSIQLGAMPAGELRFVARGLDPGDIDPRWPGALDAVGTASLGADGDFALLLAALEGRLREREFAASGRIERRAGALHFTEVQARAGGNLLRVDGSWGERLDFGFDLDAPDLDALLPGLGGTLRSAGRIAGTPARPELALDLEAGDLAFADWQVARLSIRGGLPAPERIALTLDAQGLAAGERPLGGLRFSAEGPLAGHRLTLALEGGPLTLQLTSTGSLVDGELRQVWTDGELTDPLAAVWRLDGQPVLGFADGQLGLAAHCWRSEAAAVCPGDLRLGPGEIEAAARIERLPVALLAALLLPEDLRFTGTADAELWFSRRDAVSAARLAWRQADTGMTYVLAEDEELSTRIPQLLVDLELVDQALRFALVVASEVGLKLTAGGHITGAGAPEAQIEAGIIADLPDLGQLAPFIVRFVDIGDLAGHANLEAQLSGAARRPVIAGGLRIAEGTLSVPEAGIQVERISLDLEGAGAGELRLRGAARSGSGELLLEGGFTWPDDGGPGGRIAVRGQDFQVLRLPDIQVDVSPDVEVRLEGGQFLVGGRVRVPLGEIRLRELPADVPRPSPDVVVHGPEDILSEPGRPLFVLERLEVELGQRVSLRGFGLETRLAGRLALAQAQVNGRQPIGGDGIITLEEGSFTALGKRLNIDRGALIFSGLLDDPGLDVRTSRTVRYQDREVTVGLLLTGTLRAIQTRIFSEPAMSEVDALAFLTLDRPLSEAGAGERGDLTGAALSLGLRQALPVAQRVGSALRLDDVGLEGGELEETEIIAGKQISSDLYVRYAYGLFSRIGTIRLVYRLTRRFSIEASSGEAQALELIYSVNW